LPSDLVTIQREQSSVDDALVTALQELGLDEDTALHVCDAISTRARLALLTSLQERLGIGEPLAFDVAELAGSDGVVDVIHGD